VQSTHTLVHTPRTAGRAGLVEQPGGRARIAPAASAGVGTVVLSRYRLLERLGAGGFGVVWRAQDELLGREVALKRIPLPDGDSERASREALAAARLAHPAIVALYEACPAPDAFYLISELVRGATLAQLIAARELDDKRVLRIGIALADALAHAHARGVIHRDVKPHNVLVPAARAGEPPYARGAAPIAKLTDFGGACLAGDDVLTRTGDVLGTLAYMAPEQSDGGTVDEAADLYSLALITYEAFSGTNPVRGPTAAATARRIGTPIEPLERKREDLPRGLTRALDRALAPDARERGTLDELRAAFERALAQSAGATPEPGAETLREHPLALARARRATRRAQVPAWEPRPTRVDARGARQATRRRPGPLAPRPQAREIAHPGEPGAVPDDRAGDAPRRRFAPPPALWTGCALAAMLWQAWTGHPGVSLLLAAALAPLALLPPARGTSERAWMTAPWALAGTLAPILGLVGLAGAYPAIAGQAARWRVRLAAGALGYWWLTLSEPLLARRLWLGAPAGTPARAVWEGSVSSAAVHVIGPMLSVGVLLGAALWGLGALCLPWIVRGRRAALDVVAVTMWSSAIAAAEPLLDRGLSSGVAHASPRGAVLGAVFGATLAVAVRALRGPV
jgi:eukaryotic-like serine/threonine-protein kinase